MHILYGGPPGTTYALYGAREPLLQAPLYFADDAALHTFIEPYFQTPAEQEIFRHALIAQGMGALSSAGLRAQVVHVLQTGLLRIAPVPVSGLQVVKTEPATAALSGKPYVPPRRENPRPAPPPPAPRHKIAVELAGQHADSVADQLVAAPVGAPQAAQRKLSPHNLGNDPHRLEWALENLPNVPFRLEYHLAMRGSTPMHLPLLASMQPVDKDTQQTRWPTVLVPLLLLRHLTPELDRTQALELSGGWVYVFLNGYLWRELQVVNIHGALSDVDLGTPDGVGDARVARGHGVRQIVVPYLLDGVEQKVALAYSPRPLPWDTLMKLGGLAPDDERFTDAVKQRAANIPIDAALRKRLLQSIDLSSYGSGFNVETGIVGSTATALRPAVGQRDGFDHWRNLALPVVYLHDPDGATRRLQIGIFFDGTDNNKDRDRNRPETDITNIAKLYDLYPDKVELDIRRIYVRGVGTISGSDDKDRVGLALGIGEEGGGARIELARKQLKDILDVHPDIDEIVFDIFGFSRGAALARHFVNCIHGGLNELKSICSVRVRFVGLFDTVGSFYRPGNADEGEFLLHLGPESAEHVVHLTAHHEKRKSFPLTSLKDTAGNLPAHFIEKPLPGVHADIGGGYPSPGHFGHYAEVLAIAKWEFNGDQKKRAEIVQAIQSRGNSIEFAGLLLLEVQHKPTQKELAIVALIEMYKHAITYGAPLRDINPNDAGYHLTEDLSVQMFMWGARGSPLELATQYLKDFIHTSHRDLPLTWIERVRDAPEPSGRRQVFPNQSQRAITPTSPQLKASTCAP